MTTTPTAVNAAAAQAVDEMPIASTDKSADEVFESLTGFEEIAIASRFGASITKLANDNETIFMRALLFTELVRGGVTAVDAHKHAMLLTIGKVKAFFADEDDVVPGDPDSESGKGEPSPASTPRTSQPSAS